MARIQPPEKAGLLLKLAHRYTRKKVGKTLETAGVMGHHNWILAGNGAFEFALQRSKRAPSRLKDLAGMKAAMMIGCPF